MKSLFKFCMDNNGIMFTDRINTGDLKVQIRIPHKQLCMTEVVTLRDLIGIPNDILEAQLVDRFEHALENWMYTHRPLKEE